MWFFKRFGESYLVFAVSELVSDIFESASLIPWPAGGWASSPGPWHGGAYLITSGGLEA